MNADEADMAKLRKLTHSALAQQVIAYTGSRSVYVSRLNREVARRLHALDEMVES